jgi:hypothetical protein
MGQASGWHLILHLTHVSSRDVGRRERKEKKSKVADFSTKTIFVQKKCSKH